MRKLIVFFLLVTLSFGFGNEFSATDDEDQKKQYYYNFEKHIRNREVKNHKAKLNGFFETEFDSLIIPIKLAGNLILTETFIDGQYGNLIFDSGSASELVLNKTYFRNYKRRRSKTVSGVNGLIQTIDVIEVDSMLFAGMTLYEKTADLIDLSRIENRVQTKVLGFFGLQMLEDYEFVIDVKNNQLKLYKLDRKGRRNSGDFSQNYDYTQKIEIINNVIFIWAEIAGKSLRFCFDTAAERNMLSHSLSKKINQTISITGRAKLIGAGSEQREVLIGEMNDFKLGDRKFENMQTLIADVSSLSTIYNTYISGVLGHDFIKQGIISVNMRKRQLNINYY